MASACLNRIGISPENLLECPPKYSSYGWFSPRLSIGREMTDEDASKSKAKRISSPVKNLSDLSEVTDPKDFDGLESRLEDPAKEFSDLPEEEDPTEFDGFEFRLDDPVMMLPADELFADGKLVPLQLSVIHQEVATSTTIMSGVRSPDTPYSRGRRDVTFAADPYFSPRAPRCSSRWKELLGFGKLHPSGNNNAKVDNNKRTPVTSSHTGTGATRSIRQFLSRSSKSSNDSSINLPLLRDTDTESVSVSSRPSLSSSSSGHDLDDLPRLSLDSDKPGKINLNMNINPNNRPKTRMVKTRTQLTEARASTRVGRSALRRSSETTAVTVNRGLSVDSPRMNSSGKIVFHSLERSSSSPSSLNGGPRFKHRGMERSYSANVRITPVLNVPVCSLRGSSKSGGMFGFPIFSQQKREASSSSSNNGGLNRSQRFHNKSRTDCS
ncbi:hypothetical protein L1987_73941 [Smallanthus sonchifolius]|uniref:Uncharacterized protein n=1 Tax=Smallanthus sonchifolius TaxID=185202 RepID=A0ACB9A0N5_9ASTR|nr:hypothetical protein L1987_73941 [Smallanthus sonchifolius]